jgi:copper resistance protein D
LLYLLSVWLHILATAAWIGGMVFIAFVLVPITRNPEYRPISASLLQLAGARLRWIGWTSLILLILTGVANLSFRGFRWSEVASGSIWAGSFGQMLGAKLMLVAVILLLSALHDFRIGPQAAKLMAEAPEARQAQQLRKAASWIGRANFLLAIMVVALAVVMIRGGI